MWTKLAKYIVWPLASIVVFLFILETALRLTGVNPHPRGFDFTVNRALDFPEIFLKDKDLLWRLRSGQTAVSEFFEGRTYHINQQGFRGDDFLPEKTGLRIAVLGNSCAFGWGVNDPDTFAERLRRRLIQAGLPTVDVYNFSVPGYTSFQGVRNFRTCVIPYKPDIVVVTFAWNDQWLAANNRPDKEIRMPPRSVIAVQNFLARFRFYRVFKEGIFSILPAPDWNREKNVLTRVSIEDFKANLTDIWRTALRDSIKVVFMTSPIPAMKIYYGLNRQSDMHELHRQYNEAIRETAISLSAGLIDLAAVFDRYTNLYDNVRIDPFHYNSHGHATAAEEIFSFLDQQGYLAK